MNRELERIHLTSECIASNKTLPSCSVIVCTRNRTDELQRCLQSIRTLCYPHIDIIVVDNASDNDKVRPIADAWGGRYIREPIIGLSRARNLGARYSDAEFVAFIDDDAVPDRHWLCNLIEEFSDPNVMAVTGLIRPATPVDATVEQYLQTRQERREFDSSTNSWFELANFGGIGDAGNMAFRRKIFDCWGGFNEHLGLGTAVPGSEEHNAFFEIIKRGYRIVFTPRSVVQHPFPRTPDEVRQRSFRYVEAGFAYMTLLFMEEPAYRRSLFSFFKKAVARRILKCRNPLLNRWDEFHAFVGGIRQYWQYRQQTHGPSNAVQHSADSTHGRTRRHEPRSNRLRVS